MKDAPARRAWFAVAAVLAASAPASAQAPESRPARPVGVDVVDDDELIDKITLACEALRAKGELKELVRLRKDPPRDCAVASVPLAARRTARLEPEDVCALAKKSLVIVGTYYQCKECEKWHFGSGSGFVAAPGGVVATCWHVLDEDDTRGETFVVAADLQGRAFAVREVLAADPEADVCLLRTDLVGPPPLPLAEGVRQGARVYCLSNPDERHATFSEGLVARWFVDREPVGEPRPEARQDGRPEAGNASRPETRPRGVPRLQVTVEFALGSSGAPILDSAANVVGLAQSTQVVLSTDDKDATALQMVMRFAAPAETVRALVRTR